jgi:hypothetical protein
MADVTSMALLDLVRKAAAEPNVDLLREAMVVMSQALMEAEVGAHVGAGRHERTAARTGQRNGYRERDWDTRVGKIGLRVPRVRDGSYFPGAVGAAHARRAGADGGDSRGVRAGCLDAAGRCPRAGAGDDRHQQVPGESALSGTGRGGRALP